ncbi:transposase-like protein [Arthrobacter globiformis]|nr:transposase-like protein [Arthrobacter globiformis]
MGANGGAAVRRALDPQQLPLRYAGRQHRDGIVKALKPVYTAPSEQASKERFTEFTAEWGQRYPAIVRLWESSWAEFVPFLEYDVEIRRVICTTNAIESINARYRRAVRARGHFPNEAAALKCLYLVTRSLDPTGGGRARWVMRGQPALNAFAIERERFRDRVGWMDLGTDNSRSPAARAGARGGPGCSGLNWMRQRT